MNRRRFLTVAGVAFAGSTAGCTSSTGNDPRTTSNPTDTNPVTKDTVNEARKLGEVFGSDDLTAVVEDVSRTQQLSEIDTAGQGNDFAVVQLAVKNANSEYDYDIDGFPPVFAGTLKDNDGYTYENGAASTSMPFVSGVISPGEVMRGKQVFKISDDASGLELLFDFSDVDVLNADRVVVDLSEEVSDPVTLSQELEVVVHDVGETVSHDGLSITMNSVEFVNEGESRNVVVDVTFENDTGGEITNTHLQELWCKDGAGHYLGKDVVASSQRSRAYSTDSDLAPGETRRGEVLFDVPREVDQLYCTYEFGEYVDGYKEFWQIE